jgi:hypothetical protein
MIAGGPDAPSGCSLGARVRTARLINESAQRVAGGTEEVHIESDIWDQGTRQPGAIVVRPEYERLAAYVIVRWSDANAVTVVLLVAIPIRRRPKEETSHVET